MIGTYKEYLIQLDKEIPDYVYLGVFCLSIIGSFFIFLVKRKAGWRNISFLLLIEYIYMIYASTVIYRDSSDGRKTNFVPFWSYRKCFQHETLYFDPEIVLNIIVFIPVGLLLALSLKRINWLNTLLIGCILSFSIEAMQFFLKRGLSEIDDIFSNTIGCMIGYSIYEISKGIYSLKNKTCK